jgi:tRNA pseudouridine55 synthase
MSGPDGVLVVDKPAGPTSHDVVDRVRRALGTRRAGHTGTLDPFATGVLPVCLGKATRLARFLSGGDKVYRAVARLGFATTTDDATGEPLASPRPVSVDREVVAKTLEKLTGEIEQVPPAYSAKHAEGARAYEHARRGRRVSLPPVRVTVHALEILELSGDRVELLVRCSSGTYVRALARDLGRELGVGGHLTELRRLRSGAFGLEDSVALDAVAEDAGRSVVALSRLLPELPAVRVGNEGRTALRHGRDLGPSLVLDALPAPPCARVRVVDEAGTLLALAVPRGFELPAVGLSAPPVLHPDLVLVD